MKKKVFSLMMTLLLAFVGVARADELTVNDGTTTNSYVPVYGFYADAYNKCEFVQPAADLAAMNGATINGMTFYASQTSVSWGSANFQVFLTEVSNTTLSDFVGDGTIVYHSGVLSIVDGEMNVTFDTPYTYNGGNLLVGIYQMATGTYVTSSWYGVEAASGSSVSGYNYSSLSSITASQRNFLPKVTFDYTPSAGGQAQAASLTLYENAAATSSYVPVYGYYADAYLKCEMVYPATELADMDGGEINSITFYANSPASEAWTGTWQVFMTEVADATISAYAGPGTVVYEGLLDGTAETMTIDFATPYTYNGGNLLIGFYQTTTGNYKSVSWAGETVSGASISGYSYSSLDEVTATQRDFLPMVTFDYVIGGEGGDDEDPENPNYTMFAQVWDPDAEEYVQVRTINVGQRPNGYWMEPYKFQLRNDGAAIDITNIDFTPADYFTVVSPDLEESPVHMDHNGVLDVELMTGETDVNGDLSWQMVALYTETRLARIWDITAEPYNPDVPDVWELACEEATTFPFTEYPAQKHNTTLHDDYNLPYPEIEDGNDAVYKLVFDHDMIISASVDTGNYENGKVALYAEDFNGEGGPMADNNITEFISGGNGAIGGYFGPFTVYEDGTATNSYVPLYGFYADAYLKCEMVYPQADLAGLAGTTINNMKFYSTNSNVSWGIANFQVFMKEVSSASISSFNGPTGATMVYEGPLSIVDGTMTVNFTTPYDYNGGNLLIGVYNIAEGTYVSCSWLGVSATGASVQGYSYTDLGSVTPTQRNFLPKVTFNDGRNRDENVLFTDDFEGGSLNNWTLIDADGDGESWEIATPYDYGIGYAHSGDYCASSWSWNNYTMDPDQYMISPLVEGATSITYYVSTNTGYPDHYAVMASSTGTSISNFTTLFEEDAYRGRANGNGTKATMAPGNTSRAMSDWAEKTVELPAGTKYVAFRHYDSYDMNYLFIDDVTIYGEDNNGGQGNEFLNPLPYTMGPEIIDFPVEPGTYYLVASDTKADFEVNINAQLMPCPDVDNFVWVTTPADDDAGVEPSDVTLSWNIPAYATEWRIILGSTYWPELDHPYTQYYPQDEDGNWTWATTLANSWNVPNDLFNNTNYFWRVEFRNDGACTDGVQSPVFGFTTHLNRPFNLQADDETVFDDQDVTLSWEIDPDRTFRKYYIYRDGVYFGQTTEHDMNATSFVVPADSLEDNHDGYVFTVSAIYDEGESAQSDPITVHVASYGSVSGTVFEQDHETGIAGATVTITGEDIWHDTHTYSAITGADGTYTIEHVEEGIYNGQASCPGYFTQVEPVQGNPFEIFHFEDTNPIDYILDENFDPVCSVLAEYYPDPEDVNAPYVKVSWGCGMPGDWIMEDFEDFENTIFAWDNDATNPWTIIAGGCNEDSQSCIKSGGAGVASVTSNLSVTVNIRYEGVMSFYGKISSEANWDYGYFYIDGVEQGSYTGTSAWVLHTFDITPGTHTFKWSYQKDASVNSNDDCFYIDNIVFYRPAEEQANNRAFSHYRVYRTSCYNDGPYDSIPNAEEPFYPNLMSTSVLSCEVTDTVYIDTYWNDPEVTPAGVYKWGVSKVYAGNRGELVEGPITWVAPVAGNAHRSLTTSEAAQIGPRVIGNAHETDRDGYIQYCTDVFDGGVGTGGSAVWWGIRFPAADLAEYDGQTLTKVGVFTDVDGDYGWDYSGDYTALVYQGGTTAPGTLVSEATEHLDGDYDWHDVTLTTPVTIDATQDLWLCFYTPNIAYPMSGCAYVGNNNTDYLSLDGTSWEHAADYGLSYTWMIRGYVEAAGGGQGQSGDQPINGGNEPIQEPRESVIVWSNCLDKDMYLDNNAVNITVLLNSADSPEGVKVNFTNLIEAEQTQYPIAEVELDETGYYGWDHFRKGDYILSLTNEGYYDIEDTVSIWEPTDLRYVMIEIIRGVENLYVSSTGWAMWDLEGGNGQGGDVEGDTFFYDFDNVSNNNFGDWTTFEGANSTSPNGWITPDQHYYGLNGYGHNESAGFAISESYITGSNEAVYPDNYLVSPQVTIGANSVLNFWASDANDQYGEEHFTVEVSTASNNTAADFTPVFETTLLSGKATRTGRTERDVMLDGVWYEFSVDLSAYAGQQAYIAFHHFDCYDQWFLAVDDVELTAGEGERHLEYYKVMCESLDHEPIFNANVPADRTFCQVDDSELVAGEIYLCKVAAVYSTGMSPWAECRWQYIPCENYAGTVNGLEVEGNTISWEYPAGGGGDDPTPPSDNATIILTAPNDIWGDGSGYQMFLDADATVAAGLPSGNFGGSIPAETLAEFEYSIPANADGNVYTSNVISAVGVNTGTVEVPAGMYDVLTVNPDGSNVWVVGTGGQYTGVINDMTFESGKTYTFTVVGSTAGDGLNLTVTDSRGYAIASVNNGQSVIGNGYRRAEGGVADMTNDPANATGTLEGAINYNYAPAMHNPFRGATAYGNVVYGMTWPNAYVSFDVDAPASVTSVGTVNVNRGGDYADGFFYGYDNNGVFYKINPETGAVVEQHATSHATMTEMAYNYANNTMYAIDNSGDGGSILTTVDLATGNTTVIGTMNFNIMAFAIDLQGNAYGIEITNGNFHSIDLGNAATTQIGTTGQAVSYVQCMNFDHNTETLYWFQISSGTDCALYTVNTSTGATTLLMSTPGEVTSFFVPYDGQPTPPTPPTPGEGILGAMIFVDGEWEAFVEYPTNSYTYEGDGNEVCVRIVHDGTHDLPEGNIYYSMSCPECEELNPSYCAPGDPIHAEVLDATDQVKIWWGVEPADPVSDWLYYDDGENEDAIGLQSGGSFYWGIKFPAASLAQYEGCAVTKIGYFDYTAHTGVVRIYQGSNGNGPSNNMVGSYNYTATGTEDWVEWDITPAAFDNTQDLWIVMNNSNGQYVAALGAYTGDPNGTMLSTDGSTWYTLSDATQGQLEGTWNLRCYVTNQYAGAAAAVEMALPTLNNGRTLAHTGIAKGGNVELLRSAEIDHFNVYRSDDNVEYTVIAAVPYDAEATYYEYIDTPETAGTYYYKVTAYYDNDCESDGAPAYDNPDNNYVQVEVTGMGENNDKVALYPNPTSGNVTIEAAGMSRITVVSVLGQVVFDTEVSVDTYTLNMAQFNTGMYMVRINTESGVVVKRVTVMQ